MRKSNRKDKPKQIFPWKQKKTAERLSNENIKAAAGKAFLLYGDTLWA